MKAYYSEGYGSPVVVLRAEENAVPLNGVFVLDPIKDDIAFKAMETYAKELPPDDTDYVKLLEILDKIKEHRKNMEDMKKWE